MNASWLGFETWKLTKLFEKRKWAMLSITVKIERGPYGLGKWLSNKK